MMQFTANDFAGCRKTQKALVGRYPDDPDIQANYGAIFARLNNPKRAREEMEKALAMGCRSINIHDGLAHMCGWLGDYELSRHYGQKALLMKDRKVCENFGYKRFKPSNRSVPSFEFSRPKYNVIAFSLWGDLPRYIDGALRNIELCPVIYPGWSCRFYVDKTVPQRFYDQAKKLIDRARDHSNMDIQVQLARMHTCPTHGTDGMIWRFRVADDACIDRFLVRDADSIINVKERVAVDDWIRSGKRFHIIRDSYAHTELIHGGLWGGVAGVLPKIEKLLGAFRHNNPLALDQIFLREMIWPLVKHDACIHDRFYHGILDGKPFSELGQLPLGKHIGQDESAWIAYTRSNYDCR